MTNAGKKRRFVVASNFSRGEQWLDQLLVIEPLRTETIATSIGDSEATIARVIEVGPDGQVTDHGETPIFWSVVRGQLTKATPETPWVAGRLVKAGNAFRLDTLTPAEETLIDGALVQVGDL